MQSQIKLAQKSAGTAAPSIITLTAGANDIDFAGCLKSMIVNADLSLTAASDPCSAARLASSLPAFQSALTTDLQALSAAYPHAQIDVMQYYNPFPPAPPPGQDACLFSQLAGVQYEHVQDHSWLKAAEVYFLNRDQFSFDASLVQTQLYNDAQQVIAQLNGAISAAAAGLATVAGTGDFAGHDFCASDPWVFAPAATADLTLTAGQQTYVGQRSYPDAACPDPGSQEWGTTFTKSFSAARAGVSGQVKLALTSNCTPHPDPAGQAALAGDFLVHVAQT